MRKVKIWEKIFFSENELEVAENLQKTGIKTIRVVGRGTVMADAKEIVKAGNFTNNLQKARKIVKKARDLQRHSE